MSEAKRLAYIELCGTHEFKGLPQSPFVKCEKGCGLEWGEINSLKFAVIVRFV